MNLENKIDRAAEIRAAMALAFLKCKTTKEVNFTDSYAHGLIVNYAPRICLDVLTFSRLQFWKLAMDYVTLHK